MSRTTWIGTSALVMTVLVLGGTPQLRGQSFGSREADTKTELAKLEGTWKPVKLLGANGVVENYPYPNDRLTFKGGVFRRTEGGKILLEGQFKIDPTQSPKTMDWNVTTAKADRPRVLKVYELDGDKLTIATSDKGLGRPLDLVPGEDRRVVVYQREKPANGDNADPLRSKLWAVMSVNQPVFVEGGTNLLQFQFALVNESDQTLDPKLPGCPRLIVNGKELDASSLPGVGPRDKRFEALPAGDCLQFGLAAGELFEQPGVYKVYWQGDGFRSPEVVFRVVKKPQ